MAEEQATRVQAADCDLEASQADAHRERLFEAFRPPGYFGRWTRFLAALFTFSAFMTVIRIMVWGAEWESLRNILLFAFWAIFLWVSIYRAQRLPPDSRRRLLSIDSDGIDCLQPLAGTSGSIEFDRLIGTVWEKRSRVCFRAPGRLDYVVPMQEMCARDRKTVRRLLSERLDFFESRFAAN